MNDFSEILKKSNFQKRLEKLIKKYKNKKIVFYGAGQFFSFIKKNYDLSGLNILAVSDKKFVNFVEPVFDEDLGYNMISPLNIYELKPDIVLISAYVDFYVEKYFCEELFVKTGHKFKYKPLCEKSWGEKIQDAWNIF
ncbi:MAG: hypothetical protein KHX03_04115 [Clostridium sp.]|nr:hypothetical protein [Clostridium sp.]